MKRRVRRCVSRAIVIECAAAVLGRDPTSTPPHVTQGRDLDPKSEGHLEASCKFKEIVSPFSFALKS